MFGLCRSIVVSLLVGAVKICMAAAQPDLPDMNTREPGEMYAMGVMLDEGAGFKPDGRRAFEWYTRAAKLGHAESMNRLGTQGTGAETADVFPYPFSDASKAAATRDSTACITYAVVPTSRSGTTSYP